MTHIKIESGTSLNAKHYLVKFTAECEFGEIANLIACDADASGIPISPPSYYHIMKRDKAKSVHNWSLNSLLINSKFPQFLIFQTNNYGPCLSSPLKWTEGKPRFGSRVSGLDEENQANVDHLVDQLLLQRSAREFKDTFSRFLIGNQIFVAVLDSQLGTSNFVYLRKQFLENFKLANHLGLV